VLFAGPVMAAPRVKVLKLAISNTPTQMRPVRIIISGD